MRVSSLSAVDCSEFCAVDSVSVSILGVVTRFIFTFTQSSYFDVTRVLESILFHDRQVFRQRRSIYRRSKTLLWSSHNSKEQLLLSILLQQSMRAAGYFDSTNEALRYCSMAKASPFPLADDERFYSDEASVILMTGTYQEHVGVRGRLKDVTQPTTKIDYCQSRISFYRGNIGAS